MGEARRRKAEIEAGNYKGDKYKEKNMFEIGIKKAIRMVASGKIKMKGKP